MQLAERMSRIAPSATMAIDAQAKKMKRDGVDVISFSVGEPDFDTPDHVKAAANEALRKGYTKYMPAAGLPELKEAVCEKFARDQGLAYDPDQIVITVGAKHAMFGSFQVFINPGDEVILPAPYWVSYVHQIRFAGGEARVIPGEEANGFKVTAEQVKAAITPRTRAIVLNTPSNPTGAVYDPDALASIAEVAEAHDLLIISDEIYEPFVYEGAAHHSVAALSASVKDRTLLVHGVSKSHAMTGWRIGFAAGPKEITGAMGSLQSHSTSNATSIAQWAAVAALRGDQAPVERMVAEFAKRRTFLVQRLRALSGVTCALPEGAFYAYPNVRAAFGRSYNGRRIENSFDLAECLLQEAHVAVVPGSAFGTEGYLRISYATSMANLEKGLDRLASFWQDLT